MSISAAKAGNGSNVLTRADVIEQLREYHARYGECLSASFNPSTARWRDREDLVERYYAGRENGQPWSSLNAMKRVFDGSFNAALTAADLPIPRPGGSKRRSGAPVTDVKVQRVYVESAKHRDLTERLTLVEGRLARALDRARAVEQPRTVVKSSAADRRKIASLERKLERVTANAAHGDVERRTLTDTNAKLAKRVTALETELENVTAQRDAALAEARESSFLMQGTSDRLDALQSLTTRLRAEMREMRDRDVEVEDESLIAAAERRAVAAEQRAARAERELAEQAAAITGERRKLTPAELKELRTSGPSGPQVLADALKELAAARKEGGNKLAAALTTLAAAALTWREQVR